MSQYQQTVIDGKTVWLPVHQEAQPKPSDAKRKQVKQYTAKRTGKRYGERKTWW